MSSNQNFLKFVLVDWLAAAIFVANVAMEVMDLDKNKVKKHLMRYLLIILSLLLVFSCNNSEKSKSNKYHIDNDVLLGDVGWDIYRLKSDSSLINGVLYCDSGIMGNIVDGKRDGPYKEWGLNGNLRIEGNYNKGSLQGYFRFWWENGNLSSEGNYHNGQRWDGIHRRWYKNGQLSSERHYKDGLGHGLTKGWDRDGNLWQEIYFIRGNERLDYILMRKLKPIIAEYHINKALKEGYKISIDDNKFICDCVYNDGDWIDNKTNDYCSHDLAQTSLYFPENRKIIVKDINNDKIDDYIINYTIEGFGGGNMYVNYNGTILGGEKLKYVATEVEPKYWTEYTPIDQFQFDLVKRMGLCRDKEDSIYNGLSDEFRELLPVCEDRHYDIFHYPPNYYVVYIQYGCGSGGCTVNLYKQEGESFVELSSIWGDLILNECVSHYLTWTKTIKLNRCWYYYNERFIVKNDNFHKLTSSFEHDFVREGHDENCFNDKLLKPYKSR